AGHVRAVGVGREEAGVVLRSELHRGADPAASGGSRLAAAERLARCVDPVVEDGDRRARTDAAGGRDPRLAGQGEVAAAQGVTGAALVEAGSLGTLEKAPQGGGRVDADQRDGQARVVAHEVDARDGHQRRLLRAGEGKGRSARRVEEDEEILRDARGEAPLQLWSEVLLAPGLGSLAAT